MIRRFSVVRRLRRVMPRTLQARLSLAFAMVIALTLGLVSVFVLNRLDDYFSRQQRTDLEERHAIVAAFVRGATRTAAGDHLVVFPDGTVNPAVLRQFQNDDVRKLIADQTAQANVIVRFGLSTGSGVDTRFIPAEDGTVVLPREAPPRPGQTREATQVVGLVTDGPENGRYTMEITIADPYTYRATAINNVTGLLIAIGLFALGLAVVVSAALARRFTNPIRQLTDASRALAARIRAAG